ncbi:trypsin-like peptidase domain-containing protein [Acerihabitans sp. TG2]|uniref:trypsin-like peptidase domain-containing protein n=1 Tax=Acerihabitans sp. TG2 TaxID=3096008 RepID=UPI002B231FA9|nr:trypsin-like peptidase domain-containing protein [Acerihabitans sp. TG2]MEA9391328.1 trypsin-like peptidase domain-containing protein [Acerihabitans sp. TG2]
MKLILTSLICGLTGCSAVGHYHVDHNASAKVDLHFIGIPVLAGAIGSSFPLTKHYSLTAGHVAKIMMVRVKAYNPTCDVAIIYHDNTGRTLPKLETAVKGEKLKMYGYNAYTAMPTSSSGTLQEFGWWKKPGTSCRMALTDAGGIQGMSGGPVYGGDGAVIGVFTATHRERNQSIFVPYQNIANWIVGQMDGRDLASVRQSSSSPRGSATLFTARFPVTSTHAK